MLKRRFASKDSGSLPTTQRSNVDGSGTSVRMEAPIVRAAKNASPYTRNSYIWSFCSLYFVYWSWNHIWYNYATTYMECEGDDCTLEILPPNRAKALKLKLKREQIIKSTTVKVDIDGELDRGDYESYTTLFNQFGKGAHVEEFAMRKDNALSDYKKKQKIKQEEFELMEKYGSAALTDPDLREKLQRQRMEMAAYGGDEEKVDEPPPRPKKERVINHNLPNLDALRPYAIDKGFGEYLLIMRKYNVEHRKRRVQALSSKINLYADGKKNKLVIQENRNVVWQAILGIIFGIFSFLFSLLLGQFSEPEKRRTTRGPGSRKNMSNSSSSSYSANRTTSIPQRQTRPQLHAQKAYGGYNPGSSSYSY